MSSVLDSVELGKHALDLLTHVKEIDTKSPAVMHIRHSERYRANRQNETSELVLTARGMETACEFGKMLPLDRDYKLFHTHVERTQQTAENIEKGIKANKANSQIIGEIPGTTIVDRERYFEIMRRLIFSYNEEYKGTREYINRWLSGFYPINVMKPSLVHAKELAAITLSNLINAGASDFHIYVSHDMWVASLFLHWLGEVSFDHVLFMDGFILQFYDDHMKAYSRGWKKEIEYPYWWKTKV